jgi:hypothetical protein
MGREPEVGAVGGDGIRTSLTSILSRRERKEIRRERGLVEKVLDK